MGTRVGGRGALLRMWAARPLGEELPGGSNNPTTTTCEGEDIASRRPNGHDQQQGLDLPPLPPPPPCQHASDLSDAGVCTRRSSLAGPKAGYPTAISAKQR